MGKEKKNEENRIATSGKYNNAWEEKNYLEIMEADNMKQTEIKEKNKKRVAQNNNKRSRRQDLLQKSH